MIHMGANYFLSEYILDRKDKTYKDSLTINIKTISLQE